MSRLGLRLTPHGRLSVEDQDDGPDIDAAASIRLIDAFARGTGYGLVWLGAAEVGQALPPLFVWWRDFAALYVGSLCLHASGLEAEERVKLPNVPAPTAAELSSLVLTAPIMAGAEYLTQDVLLTLWDEMERAFAASLAAAKVGLQAFLTTLNRAWNLVGRVHFNLAENRRDPDQPFAFMATYTTRLSAQAKAQHVPLGQALREYAGAANRDKLLSLLLPVQRAAEHCAWLKPMIDAGDIFHPLRWGPTDASRFLQSVPELERAGVVVRMPVSWRASRPARPQVTATVGSRAPSAVGLDGLLDFQMGVMLDGEPLTEVEGRDPARRHREPRAAAWSMGRGRSGAASTHNGTVPRSRKTRGPRRPHLRGGDADAGRRRRYRGRPGRDRYRLGAGNRRTLAGADA